MQTFLPYRPTMSDCTDEWSFANSAKVLDSRRLNKQVLEASQILDILCGKYADARYRNHPAVLQWAGHEWVLLDYLTDMCLEAKARKIRCSIFDRLSAYNCLMPHQASGQLPEWMENEQVFASHRSRLLFKGRCDSALEALKSFTRPPKGVTIRFWLISDDSPIVVSDEYVKNRQMQMRDLEQIEDHCIKYRVEIPPNHYLQFKWSEPINLPYVWPVTIAAIREQAMRESWNG